MAAELPTIHTSRLILRPWRDSDLEPFAALNADPRVMEFFVAPLTREQSDLTAAFFRKEFARNGYGLFAVEPRDAPFVGFIGLHWSTFQAAFTPALEIGFRLAVAHWGKGYATEGGKAVIDWLFTNTAETLLHSWTAVLNKRSQRVIGKLGLQPAGEFEHPNGPEHHALRPHVRFTLTREQWQG